MKNTKKLCSILCAGLMLLSLAGCGTENTTAAGGSGVQSGKETVKKEEKPPELKKDDFAFSIEENIVDGERKAQAVISNQSEYPVTSWEVQYAAKTVITEEEKMDFYSDLQTNYELSDEDLEKLKKEPIGMNTDSEKIVDTGAEGRSSLCYFRGYYYVKDISHCDLVEPDIATITYLANDKLYTAYYDFRSGKFTYEEDAKPAKAWSQYPIGEKIPKPDAVYTDIMLDDEDRLHVYAYGFDLDGFNAYQEACIQAGYTVDPLSHEGFYAADNADGYDLYMNYDEDEDSISISISAPDEEAAEETVAEENAEEEPENTEETEEPAA